MALTATLPTLYEYYTTGGINQGLNANGRNFTLNNREIFLYSGAIHYFRIPQEYWRDRLRKARAAGLNTIETYIPWNLHEPTKGVYDFGEGGSDMQNFLNIKKFLQIAREEDLLVVIRPGPYICAEWEFGGFPSWLLREKNIKLRTSEPTYMKYVTQYFNVLLPILAMFQFSLGGPVVAFQLENEYGSTVSDTFQPDKKYLRSLRQLMKENGIVELLFTSDSQLIYGDGGMLTGEILATSNFNKLPEENFKALENFQPNKPVMCMEYWCGWYDHWSGNQHKTVELNEFSNTFEKILAYPASVNLYMFVGGTNWGFLNGANIEKNAVDNSNYLPDTTSYDYDAILQENGNYTDKYFELQRLLKKYNPVKLNNPAPPKNIPVIKYNNINIIETLDFNEILKQVDNQVVKNTFISMENLPINNGSGQSYGYICYRIENIDIPSNSKLKVNGYVYDQLLVLINGELINNQPLTSNAQIKEFGYWKNKDGILNFGPKEYKNATLDLLVENWGRNNYGKLNQFNQFKGIWNDVLLNSKPFQNLTIYPLEFKKNWNSKLKGWQKFTKLEKTHKSPSFYKGVLTISETPQDTYLDMRDWNVGFVIVNNFVLGRHFKLGPQLFLYLPATLLKIGDNEILIFEHFQPFNQIKFSNKQIFK